MRKDIKELQEPCMIRLKPSFKQTIEISAERHNEGNFNKEVRDLIRIGLKERGKLELSESALEANFVDASKSNCNIDSVINRCSNCNQPIIYDDFLKIWRHDRLLAFFDNGHYCNNLNRENDKYAQHATDL